MSGTFVIFGNVGNVIAVLRLSSDTKQMTSDEIRGWSHKAVQQVAEGLASPGPTGEAAFPSRPSSKSSPSPVAVGALTPPAASENICSNNTSGGNGCVYQSHLLLLSWPSH